MSDLVALKCGLNIFGYNCVSFASEVLSKILTDTILRCSQ